MIQNIELTTPALLFSTVSLVMLAYTNRFLALAKLIRDLYDKHHVKPDSMTMLQIQILVKRVNLVKKMQFLCVSALLLSVLSMLCLVWDVQRVSAFLFILALVLLSLSLLFSVWEISLSTQALDVSLNEMQLYSKLNSHSKFTAFKFTKSAHLGVAKSLKILGFDTVLTKLFK